MGKPFSFRHRFFSRFHDVIISKIGRGCLVGAALRADRPTLPTSLLVGAALRAVRTPTNMGVAQLASHSPHYPNSRMLPIFHFLRRLPQRSRRRRAPTSEPIGRGGTPLLVGAALRAVRTPTNMGVAQLASHSPLYPNSRMRSIFSFPAAPAAAVTPDACPYHANPPVGAATPLLVGAALRADRAKRTPRRGAPTNTMPGSLSRSINKNPRHFSRGR